MKIMRIKLNTLNDANSLVKSIDKYNYDIDAVCGRYVIDAKSIMGLFPKEIFIVIHTNNKDVISKFEEDISKWKVEE